MAALVVLFVHRPCGSLLRLSRSGRCHGRQHAVERCQHIVGDVEARSGAKRGTGIHQDIRTAPLHRRLQQRDQLGVDLLADMGLVALDLVLLALKFLRSGWLPSAGRPECAGEAPRRDALPASAVTAVCSCVRSGWSCVVSCWRRVLKRVDLRLKRGQRRFCRHCTRGRRARGRRRRLGRPARAGQVPERPGRKPRSERRKDESSLELSSYIE